ncbi:hypothetical protein Glove_117g434 [Diversispora epigaea]|uniref:Uncharacterized protein n=1 Tax=Diversispora epigaea TaxID=1348612 RepID=A0A397J0S7_9GLOM|nr:hypothetical protein Glove_117g434 [Diversispora epigaea]
MSLNRYSHFTPYYYSSSSVPSASVPSTSSVPSASFVPSAHTLSFASNTVSFIPPAANFYYSSYYYDPSHSYAAPCFVNSAYFTPSTYVSPASSTTLTTDSSTTFPASSTTLSASTTFSASSSITTASPAYITDTSFFSTTTYSSSITPSYASVFTYPTSTISPNFFATTYLNPTTTTSTNTNTISSTNHHTTSFAQAIPSSSRASSVAPDDSHTMTPPPAISRHDAMKSTLTSPDIEFYSPKVVNRAQLSVIKHCKKKNKKSITPYISSCLNDRGTGDHLEMAEDICKHYITSPPVSHYLWNHLSRAESIAFRRRTLESNLGMGFSYA